MGGQRRSEKRTLNKKKGMEKQSRVFSVDSFIVTAE